MKTINQEIKSKFLLPISLKIEGNKVSFFHDTELIKEYSVLPHHTGNGFNQKLDVLYGLDFNFIKVISACEFIMLNDWKREFNSCFTPKFNTKINSYGLKHRIEERLLYQEITKCNGEEHNHLGNGELIMAMILLGFCVKDVGSINVLFNLDKNFMLKLSAHNDYKLFYSEWHRRGFLYDENNKPIHL